ncbi:hypothetical protein BDY17DRAFT_735 [Neohortaea acidophila]|uniref:Chromosome segregation ATPase family protein n=1 Tax=Neohortaea acidophila TaxID=245834 RepID=A0A6A6Q3M7_9PEZI|nr:uncharacterized protein BDY17DRAFT_735 [Neohortaea acidophila]KAF2487000.1 hypothetical protein BDY17DRAFT_735 [Neohortaea acidophila]
MPASERDLSRDREYGLRHQHSSSDCGRSSVPMWDSSDPDRAPPPLPLNPSHTSPTKANTSSGIAAAARQIVEKCRESAPLSSYTSNREQSSPERSLVKGSQHRRLNTLQTNSVKDLRNYLDNRSPERSPERPLERRSSTSGFSTPIRESSRELLPSSRERSTTPTPVSRDSLKEITTPTLRPSTRSPTRPLLGENTPPSATMRALQNMQVPEPSLVDITNGPTTPTGLRPSAAYDFSSQLLNLTAIATNLQQEMKQLSRRSKDNATDLISLKDATSKRDEDIRKSLRDLTTNMSTGSAHFLGPPPGSTNRSTSSLGNILDSKPFNSPPSASKGFNLPRASSAHGFLEERVGSPSPYSIEGAASVAMLEKIVREMVTKDGQERLQSSLSELLEKSTKENSAAAKKVEELSAFIKEKSHSQAVVPFAKDGGPPRLDLNFDSPGLRTREAGGREAVVMGLDDQIMKMLQRIKDSIAHSGGTTAEVKGLVRDLRGEVLGMGRELGHKLNKVTETQLNTTLDRSIEAGQGTLDTDEIQRIVEEGMSELKDHMTSLWKQRSQQDDDSFRQLASTGSAPNSDEMFTVVKHALAEHGGGIATKDFAVAQNDNNIDREDVLEAVKEGLKDFEPNIELQQFGLERDEILTVLKEGFEQYESTQPGSSTLDKGEIYEAMHEALKDFRPPLPEEQMEQMKDDMLRHVRQALLEYMPDTSAVARTDEATRIAIIAAVQDGLAEHGSAAPRELEISRDDLFAAVKASLDGSSIPFGGFGEQVIQQLHELIDGMRMEFKEYTAANGRDTEQVLDAIKDGLERLRAEIESYVDRAQDVTGKDEIIETVRSGLDGLHGPGFTGGSRDEMLQYVSGEFERLHRAIGVQGSARDLGDGTHNPILAAEIILAIKEGLDELKHHSRGVASRETGEDGPGEEMLEAMREEFDQLKSSLLNANAIDKSELIETMQDSMGAMHAKFSGSQLNGISGGATEEIINEIHAEFNEVKQTLQAIIGEADRDFIIAGIRTSLDDLRVQLSADQSDASAEALCAIKAQLAHINATPHSRGIDEDTSTIRSGLDELRDTVSKTGVNDELLEALRGEFENLRGAIASSGNTNQQHEEILDELHVGLDDLRTHVDKKFDNPDHAIKQHGDLLDALNDGLESMRTDIVKTLDKPLDMTVNYEILDTLKDGLASLRVDMDKLKGGDGASIMPGSGEVVLADGAAVGQARDMNGDADATAARPTNVDHGELEKMQVLLAQLQIKIEAMDATMQDLPGLSSARFGDGAAIKDEIAAVAITLKEIHDNVSAIAGKDGVSAADGAATKADTDAIETLLRNTKAQLEDMAFPDPASLVTKEHLDAVEAAVRLTNDGIDGLVDKLDNSAAARADVAVVEVLAQDIKTALDDVKHTLKHEKPDLMTKADLDVLGVIVTEIKTRVGEMELPDPADQPSKADIEQLHGLINDFRESHDKMRESYETDIAVTAKAFDDRKKEFLDTIEEISTVRKALATVKDEVMGKLGHGESSLDDLGETLDELKEKTGPLGDDLKQLIEQVTLEFQRSHTAVDSLKADQQHAMDSSKDAVVLEVGEKFETYFDGLMSKYDDAQRAAEESSKVMESKAAEQEGLLNSMKAMAEELRLSIDTLGSTLTTFPETMEKLVAESKTVFDRVDDTYNKLDETQAGLKFEHSVTRDEVAKILATVGNLQSDAMEHNPRFMIAMKEVQALIGQHYEHSQKASEAAAEHAQAVRDLQEQVRGIGSQNEELKTNVSSLPRLMPAPSADTVPVPEKFDDTAIHEKLDKLMGQAQEGSSSSTQLERLDQIHEKVMSTAAEVSAFVAMQTKQITEDHLNKEKEAEELALLLEKRQAQKDEIEDDITVLNEEKDSLRTAVEALRAEKEALVAHKARLSAEVSSLETAMQIRREELHDMDHKAETIERRILEGVMNQSRMLLLTKNVKSAPAPKKKPQGRDLRIPSNSSAASAQTVTSSLPALKANHALTMKSRPALARNDGALKPSPATAERRIMSLNQINHNVPTGVSAYSPTRALIGSNLPKRSHSVRNAPAPRKPSWAAKRIASLADHDKENDAALSDVSEDEFQRPESRDMPSERSGSGMYLSRSHSRMTDGDDAHTGEPRSSIAPSDLSYMTGSYLTGSSEADRNSIGRGSSANAVLGQSTSLIEEDPSEEFHELDGDEEDHTSDRESANEQETARSGGGQWLLDAPHQHAKELQIYAPPSDSGLGTDAPTTAPALSCIGRDYFE